MVAFVFVQRERGGGVDAMQCMCNKKEEGKEKELIKQINCECCSSEVRVLRRVRSGNKNK